MNPTVGRIVALVSKSLAIATFLVGTLLMAIFLTVTLDNWIGAFTPALVGGVLLLGLAALFIRPWWFNPFVLLDWERPLKTNRRHGQAPPPSGGAGGHGKTSPQPGLGGEPAGQPSS